MSVPGAYPWTCGSDHVVLHVRLTPKSSLDALEGVQALSDGRTALKARVRAAPENDKANDALVRLLAKTMATPRSRLEIVSGATSRLKSIRIDGRPSVIEIALKHLSGLD